MKYIKTRNTDHMESPFEGVVLFSNMECEVGSTVNMPKYIRRLKANSDVEGVVFKGDWHKRPLEFINVLEELKDSGLQVVINTEVSMDDFKLELGVASFNKVNHITMKMDTISENDKPMLTFIGGVLIDFYLNYTEYFFGYKENDEYKLVKIDLPKEELEDGESK